MIPVLVDRLNDQSRVMIENISNGFKSLPDYKKYNIYVSHAWELTQAFIAICIDDAMGNTLERFDFYPSADRTTGQGRIDSIAIYGYRCHKHLQDIEKTMKIFGLGVKEIVDEGDFVDVYLLPY